MQVLAEISISKNIIKALEKGKVKFVDHLCLRKPAVEGYTKLLLKTSIPQL